MSWMARKLTKSDWLEPKDYIEYFRGKASPDQFKQMETWHTQKVLKELHNENKAIWESYIKARNITV